MKDLFVCLWLLYDTIAGTIRLPFLFSYLKSHLIGNFFLVKSRYSPKSIFVACRALLVFLDPHIFFPVVIYAWKQSHKILVQLMFEWRIIRFYLFSNIWGSWTFIVRRMSVTETSLISPHGIRRVNPVNYDWLDSLKAIHVALRINSTTYFIVIIGYRCWESTATTIPTAV